MSLPQRRYARSHESWLSCMCIVGVEMSQHTPMHNKRSLHVPSAAACLTTFGVFSSQWVVKVSQDVAEPSQAVGKPTVVPTTPTCRYLSTVRKLIPARFLATEQQLRSQHVSSIRINKYIHVAQNAATLSCSMQYSSSSSSSKLHSRIFFLHLLLLSSTIRVGEH